MSKSKLLEHVRTEIRRRNYSYHTEQAYCQWVVRYIKFHSFQHPTKLKTTHVVQYLNYLAVERRVAASTQNQALCAIIFLYQQVLGIELKNLNGLRRAKESNHLPVVLSPNEAKQIITHLHKVPKLVVLILYGSGLRLSEALGLRVKDIDFAYNQIIVRDGKGMKDRVTILPESLIKPLKIHIQKVKNLHKKDIQKGWGNTLLPNALASKYPSAPRNLVWQYLFPSSKRRYNPRSGITYN